MVEKLIRNWPIGLRGAARRSSTCGAGCNSCSPISAERPLNPRGRNNEAIAGNPIDNGDIAHNPPIKYQVSRLPNYQRQRGFTLIELLVVLTMIVVLASMGLAQYRISVIHSREAVLREDLFRMREAIDQYYADKGQWPSTLDALVSDGYLRKLPNDPFTKETTSWQAIPAEPDPNNPTAEPGVYDVKSGSDATALDGSKYAEW
jgi:general secretion pathway protein G